MLHIFHLTVRGLSVFICFLFAYGPKLIVLHFQEADSDNPENMEEDIDGDLADIETLNYDDLDSVSKLQKTQRYADIMQVSVV